MQPDSGPMARKLAADHLQVQPLVAAQKYSTLLLSLHRLGPCMSLCMPAHHTNLGTPLTEQPAHWFEKGT